MRVYGLTDKGQKRIINEDSFYTTISDDEKTVFGAICDGMGGANGGEVASSIAVDVMRQKTDSSLNRLRRSQWGKFLREIATSANRAIYDKSIESISLSGMGTTFVGVLCNDNKACIANVGDSRAYLINKEEIRQISKDHSLVNELVDKGELSLSQVSTYPNKNVITRALGVDQNVECDIFDVNVSKGQYILLCSDGLIEDVSEPEILFEVVNGDTIENICKSLIDIANLRGGHDNITIVIVEF